MGKLQTKTLVLSFSCLSSALHLFVCSFSLSFVSNEGVEPRWQLHDYEFSLIHFVRILLLLTLFPNEDKDYLFFHENVKKKEKKGKENDSPCHVRLFVKRIMSWILSSFFIVDVFFVCFFYLPLGSFGIFPFLFLLFLLCFMFLSSHFLLFFLLYVFPFL